MYSGSCFTVFSFSRSALWIELFVAGIGWLERGQRHTETHRATEAGTVFHAGSPRWSACLDLIAEHGGLFRSGESSLWIELLMKFAWLARNFSASVTPTGLRYAFVVPTHREMVSARIAFCPKGCRRSPSKACGPHGARVSGQRRRGVGSPAAFH